MVSRRRGNDEEFGDYREALKAEAKLERVKLKGKWVYRSSMMHPLKENVVIKTPPHKSTEIKPARRGAARRQYLRDERQRNESSTEN